MNEVALTIAVVIAFFFVFPLFWLGIVYLLSRLGGWPGLARHYAYHGTFSGTTFNMQSATTGPLGNYRNCMTFGVNDDGLYMSPLVFFRPGHPPLLIPWDEIEARESQGFSLSKKVGGFCRLERRRTDDYDFEAARRKDQ